MKKNLNLLIAIIGLVAIFASSCSVTKRYHNKGFHFDLSSKTVVKNESVKKAPVTVVEEESEVAVVNVPVEEAEVTETVATPVVEDAKEIVVASKVSKRKLIKELKAEMKNVEMADVSNSNEALSPDKNTGTNKTQLSDTAMTGLWVLIGGVVAIIIAIILAMSLTALGVALILYILGALAVMVGGIIFLVGLIQG